jgi:hypothetical protein
MGGGVAILIKDYIPYATWPDLIDGDFETIWVSIRPPKMPRMFSHITLGVVYHPPNSNNWKMTQHISKCTDAILQKHPHSGIIITGDFNKFKDNSIKSAYSLKQIVSKPTRGSNILDKVLTNMFHLYNTPEILPHIG